MDAEAIRNAKAFMDRSEAARQYWQRYNPATGMVDWGYGPMPADPFPCGWDERDALV